MIKDIPLIIPNFNQLSYLRNIINWWSFYYPNNKVIIIDNGSSYKPLIDWYLYLPRNVSLLVYTENNFRKNLKDYIDRDNHEYYVISDPDIMPHPDTPPDFLEVFKRQIESGYHHVGFQLIIDDLPEWLHNKAVVIHNEMELRNHPVTVEGYQAFKAPIDTTFALYSSKNGGWESPMKGPAWDNSLRLFKAFHLPWYINGDKLTPEMENYFSTARYHKLGEPSSGSNNYRPKQYI